MREEAVADLEKYRELIAERNPEEAHAMGLYIKKMKAKRFFRL